MQLKIVLLLTIVCIQVCVADSFDVTEYCKKKIGHHNFAYFEHPEDCHSFICCVKHFYSVIYYVLPCPANLYYDINIHTCVREWEFPKDALCLKQGFYLEKTTKEPETTTTELIETTTEPIKTVTTEATTTAEPIKKTTTELIKKTTTEVATTTEPIKKTTTEVTTTTELIKKTTTEPIKKTTTEAATTTEPIKKTTTEATTTIEPTEPTDPEICWKPKDNGFGVIKIKSSGKLSKITMKHVRGEVSCNEDIFCASYWGCSKPFVLEGKIGTLITDSNNNLLFPTHDVLGKFGFYYLFGFDEHSNELELTFEGRNVKVSKDQELRIWYSEDYLEFIKPADDPFYAKLAEDNIGEHCAKVSVNIV